MTNLVQLDGIDSINAPNQAQIKVNGQKCFVAAPASTSGFISISFQDPNNPSTGSVLKLPQYTSAQVATLTSSGDLGSGSMYYNSTTGTVGMTQSSGSGSLGTVTSVTIDSPNGTLTITNPTVTASGTIHADLKVISGVSGSYTYPSITVNNTGQITAIATQAPVTSYQATGSSGLTVTPTSATTGAVAATFTLNSNLRSLAAPSNGFPYYNYNASNAYGYYGQTSNPLLNTLPNCHVIATSALPNSPTYTNTSSGQAATLAPTSGTAALTIDSVQVDLGDYVLVAGQASAIQNGIYVLTQLGSATYNTHWILTRAATFNTVALINGANTASSLVYVSGGTTNNNTYWKINSAAITAVGTGANNITFTTASAPTSTVTPYRLSFGNGFVSYSVANANVNTAHLFVVPNGITMLKVTCVGGGGGGGNANNNNTVTGFGMAGGGGGSGAVSISYIPTTTGTSYSIIVGAGGSGGTAGSSGTANSGAIGKQSQFYLTSVFNAGAPTGAPIVNANGGNGGAGCNSGSTTILGGDGGHLEFIAATNMGSIGQLCFSGFSGSSSYANSSNIAIPQGQGGNSPYGAGGAATVVPTNTTVPGKIGYFGGGGGGATANGAGFTFLASAGGTGGDGLVIIEY